MLTKQDLLKLRELPKLKSELEETGQFIKQLQKTKESISEDRHKQLASKYEKKISELKGKIENITTEYEERKDELKIKLNTVKDKREKINAEMEEISHLKEQKAISDEEFKEKKRQNNSTIKEIEKERKGYQRDMDEIEFYLSAKGDVQYRREKIKGKLLSEKSIFSIISKKPITTIIVLLSSLLCIWFVIDSIALVWMSKWGTLANLIPISFFCLLIFILTRKFEYKKWLNLFIILCLLFYNLFWFLLKKDFSDFLINSEPLIIYFLFFASISLLVFWVIKSFNINKKVKRILLGAFLIIVIYTVSIPVHYILNKPKRSEIATLTLYRAWVANLPKLDKNYSWYFGYDEEKYIYYLFRFINDEDIYDILEKMFYVFEVKPIEDKNYDLDMEYFKKESIANIDIYEAKFKELIDSKGWYVNVYKDINEIYPASEIYPFK